MKKISINCGILVGTILVCLIVFEVSIRVFELTPDIFLQLDSRTGVWHIPNKKGIYFRRDIPKTRVTINSYGLRDNEYSQTKPDKTYRITVLGDSFTQAIHVPLEKTYQQILERTLNAEHPATHFEVINFGVGGFGTTHEYFVFMHHVLHFDPDMVVQGFTFGNDIFENSPVLNGRKYLPYLIIGEEGTLLPIPPEPVPYYMRLGKTFKVIPFVYYRLVDGNAKLDRALRGLKRGGENTEGFPMEYSMYSPAWEPAWEEAWEITKKVLSHLYSETKQRNIHYMIVGIPDQIQVDPQIRKEVLTRYPTMEDKEWDWEKPNRLVQRFCQTKGIHYVDLSFLFKKTIRQGSPPLYYHYDGHWNQNGHQLAAEGIYRNLREQLPSLLNAKFPKDSK